MPPERTATSQAAAMSDELASLRARLAAVEQERDRLREACQLAAEELTRATWAKGADQRGLKYAIEKCRAALTTTEGSQP